MNILLSIHHRLNKNEGAPGVTYQLYQEYKELGHEVSIFSIDDIPSFIPNKLKSFLFPVFFYFHVKKTSRKKKIHVIDASSGDSWILSLLRNNKRNLDTVLVARSHGLEHTVHQSRLDQQRVGDIKLSWKYPIYHGGLRLWEVSTSFKKADGCLFLNKHDLQYALKNIKANERYSRIISNGLPNYFLNLSGAIKPVPSHEKMQIAQVGSYIPRKGILYTAKAMNVILEQFPSIELSFIGTGCSVEKVLMDYKPEFHNRIHVISKYNHEDLPKLLIGKHILMFPSLAEGFPLVLIEAMACGLLPIATSTPGPLTILKDGYDSVIVPPADSKAIENSLHNIVTDPERLNQIRINAYKSAQRYKWSVIAKETIEFYEEIRLGKSNLNERTRLF
ncbi:MULTISPECIES: glycosyltransferase family 4 protein [Paenibacillus]|uniref:Glycosyl transferase family 1 domain-containing protein n=1 Tax=Paenibacillus lautus TaxID=1401 RepID=A0A1R1B411_PAELA|nr:glycosyltransferase family 4 protein [Paenibacillus lautus]OME93890.1 hypothetical protein BK123_11655 [Paenibacillus lautus]